MLSRLVAELLLLIVLSGFLAYMLLLLWEFIRLGRGDVPFVPSTTTVIQAVIDAGVLPRDGMILDLGCGDGKALRMMARAGYRGPLIGYERAPMPWIFARIMCWWQRTPVVILREDFSDAPLAESKGLYLFLLKETLEKLSPRLQRELPPGTPVVSAEFEITGWIPDQVLVAKGITSKEAKIFIYRISPRA